MEISERLASALDALVRATDAAQAAPSDGQATRRAIEQSSVVAQMAKREGFGEAEESEAEA